MATALKAARVATGWSARQLIARMREVAALAGEDLPGFQSIRVMLARWENGYRRPCEFYRRVFCQVYQRSPEQLGFPARSHTVVGVDVICALLYVAPLTTTQLRSVPAARVRLYVSAALAEPRAPTPADLEAGLHQARTHGPAWLDRDRLQVCEQAAHRAHATPSGPGRAVGTVPDWVTEGRLTGSSIAAGVFTTTR